MPVDEGDPQEVVDNLFDHLKNVKKWSLAFKHRTSISQVAIPAIWIVALILSDQQVLPTSCGSASI
jgi:hypothetical protein